jgi:phosphorylase kinase gamma subunit
MIGSKPYENRFVRKLIDACAFQIYSPWVKRGEEQNRAALFETTPKVPVKYTPPHSSAEQNVPKFVIS